MATHCVVTIVMLMRMVVVAEGEGRGVMMWIVMATQGGCLGACGLRDGLSAEVFFYFMSWQMKLPTQASGEVTDLAGICTPDVNYPRLVISLFCKSASPHITS